jgi:hypothetical protein
MAVIGAPGVDLPPNGMAMRDDAGAAYDFRRDPDTGLFSQRTELTASDAMADEAFGSAVIVACDTIIIGAPDVDLAGLLIDAGAAFVFQTFEAEEESDDKNNNSGSGCFIDTAGSGSGLNPVWFYAVLGAVVVCIFYLAFWRKK